MFTTKDGRYDKNKQINKQKQKCEYKQKYLQKRWCWRQSGDTWRRPHILLLSPFWISRYVWRGKKKINWIASCIRQFYASFHFRIRTWDLYHSFYFILFYYTIFKQGNLHNKSWFTVGPWTQLKQNKTKKQNKTNKQTNKQKTKQNKTKKNEKKKQNKKKTYNISIKQNYLQIDLTNEHIYKIGSMNRKQYQNYMYME